MYFAMDEIGFENTELIKTIEYKADIWKFIYDVAKTYGFDGIHFTPSLYKIFNLDIKHIPDYFKEFRLTLHLGGIHTIISENDNDIFEKEFENAFGIALEYNMHDVSIHPPYIYKLTAEEKSIALDYLDKSIDKWIKKLSSKGISLSLETHVTGEWFLFDGLHEYVKFINNHPALGVLIDISHNYYNPQYSEHDIINILGNKNVKGLHISDALRSAEFFDGTHLAIGSGTIDFPILLKGFEKFTDLYCVLEIKSQNEGIESSLKILKKIVN